MTIIDTHHHVWDLSTTSYDWMNDPKWNVIRRNWSLDDVRAEMRACGIGATVLVQAKNDWADCQHGLASAARDPMIAGFVGWFDLADPARGRAQLEELAAHPKFVGMRHVLAFESDMDWVLQPKVLESLSQLAARGLVFEVSSDHLEHLRHVEALAEKLPELRMVVNHVGKPPVGARGWEPWAGVFARASTFPNVFAKLSGLTTPAREKWSGDEFKPYIEYAVEKFGAERLMYGSNWPVTLVAGSYTRQWEEMQRAMSGLSAAQRKTLLEDTAVRCYRLKLQ